jgi:hypothetical protein
MGCRRERDEHLLQGTLLVGEAQALRRRHREAGEVGQAEADRGVDGGFPDDFQEIK